MSGRMKLNIAALLILVAVIIVAGVVFLNRDKKPDEGPIPNTANHTEQQDQQQDGGAMKQTQDLRAVEPIACYEDLLGVVTNQAPGVPLNDLLATDAAWPMARWRLARLEEALRRTGQWIAVFQRIATDGAPAARPGSRRCRAGGAGSAASRRPQQRVERCGGLVAPREAELRRRGEEALHEILVLLGKQGARTVDEHAAGPQAGRGVAQQRGHAQIQFLIDEPEQAVELLLRQLTKLRLQPRADRTRQTVTTRRNPARDGGAMDGIHPPDLIDVHALCEVETQDRTLTGV